MWMNLQINNKDETITVTSQNIFESWSSVYHVADTDIYKERIMLL